MVRIENPGSGSLAVNRLGRPSPRVVTVSFVLAMLIGWQLDAIGAQLDLTWLDSATDVARFAIERSTGTTAAFAEITRTAPGVTACVSPVPASRDYYDRRHTPRVTRRAIGLLERQGYRVVLKPAA